MIKHISKILAIVVFPVLIFSATGFYMPALHKNSNNLLFLAIFEYIGETYYKTESLSEKYESDSLPIFKSELITITPPEDIELEDSIPAVDFVMFPADSTFLISDSVRIADSLLTDTLKVDSMALDSTARMKYFRHSREDKPNLLFREKRPSPFFLIPATKYLQRTVELDSTGEYVNIKEKVAGQEPRPYLKVPREEYIKMKMESLNRDLWEDLGYKYELKASTKDLGQLITDITNIQIPLPSTSFLSIFGPPEINLRINGAVDIHGAWRSETTEGISSSRLGNTRNEPDFKQQVQINVNGTIGDKLTISADWNTERQFEYENQLKIKYTGYEDEIIQSIEAGNVSLQTSPLVGGSEALFGIKANFQMGPFTLTALASQKKGEVQEVSVSGGSEKQKFEIHAYEYSMNHFFVDKIYADTSEALNLFKNYYANPVPLVNEEFRIKDMEVWKTITGIVQPDEKKGNAFIDLAPRVAGQLYDDLRSETLTEERGKSIIGGRFIRLTEGVDYDYHPETGYISFKTQVQDEEAIAVAFRQEGAPGPENDIFYGEFIQDLAGDTSKTIVLKLVKPKNLQPKFSEAWSLHLKNIYPIGGRDVKEEGFTLDIKYIIDGQDPVSELGGRKLIQAFLLDKTDQSGTSSQPDGAFDFFPGRTIIPATGEIIFPVLQPFGKNFPGNLADTLRYQAVYDTTVTFAKQDRAKDKFIIAGEYSASVSSVYNIGFNTVENSVRVLLNGNELKEGSDYSVDYNIGQITIRNDAALVPGADLRITYEQNDLFQLASKTLLGFRGLYEFSKKTKLGFSYLNLNQQTLSDKVRIGEEPLNNSIYGLDFQTAIDLPFLTKAIDNVISTKAMSQLSFKGEYAYIDPDPNTKKSTIASDNNKSIAYIDDFEGAKRIIPIGVSDRSWRDLSVPDRLPFISNFSLSEQMGYKAKSYWFNIIPPDVKIQDIWGTRKRAAREDEQVSVLDFVYQPTKKGTYNWNPTIENTSNNWGGMMKLLSSTANNLVEENVEFIEFWAKVIKAPANSKLYLDLGQISEDVIPNNKLDTEDKNQNDLEEEGEDTGIDGLFDSEEPGYNSSTNSDPSGDNFFVDINTYNYDRINGTEGNAAFRNAGIKLPDSEDLNRNFTLDRVNSYYRYEVPLDTSYITNEFIAGGGDNDSWYLYRIPLKDFIATVGDPSFSVVEFIRLWVSGSDEDIHIRFAEMNLVGNQWQKQLTQTVTQDDTVLTIGTINVEDNPNYRIPPGVFREKDRSKPDQDVLKNEQSLQLILKELEDGDYREAVKYLFRPLDVFNYKEMKLFIHGELTNMPGSISYYVDENNYSSEVYFRFGSDSLNYYEYRQPVQPDWNEISMKFDELTAIKQRRDTAGVLFRSSVPGQPGHSFGVRGNPTLTRVTFFTVGIINPKDKGTVGEKVSGEIWVNELRVLDAEDTPGWAYSASTSLQFADVLTVSLNASKTNPYFHKLSERFGSRVDRDNWGASLDLDIIKLIPANLSGSNLKLNYSRTESISKPLYFPGTDIAVDQAAEQAKLKLIESGATEAEADKEAAELKSRAQTLNISDSWALPNIRIKIPSSKWYIRDTFNSLSFSFNYNKTISRSPTVLTSRSWVWNATGRHSLNLSQDYFFYPANIPLLGSLIEIFTDYRNAKIYFTPQNITSGVSLKRNQAFTQNRGVNVEPSIQRDFTSTRNFSYAWKITEGGIINVTTNYSADFSSSLAYLLTNPDENGKLIDRSESDIWRDIFNSEFFGKDFNFKQNFDLKTSPKLPSIWDLNKYFSVNAGYGASYTWQNNFTQGELGRGAGFSNRITAGLNLRWKSLTAPLFDEEASGGTQGGIQPRNTRGRGRTTAPVNQPQQPTANDSTSVADSTAGKPSILTRGLAALKATSKWIFFDYEQISLNFNQTNSLSGGGLTGEGTGFSNFWGIRQKAASGPTRAFMLGLSYDLGPRAPNGNLSDNFSQKNTIDFKTSRPLWEGAQLDLNWKVGWGLNKSTKLTTDEDGNIFVNNINSTGTLERSFLSFPPSFFLSIFGSGIKKVNELYNPASEDPNKNLSEAFIEGFESFPILANVPFLSKFAAYIPRPNWRINWSGLEKLSFFKNFAKRVSLSHAYNSSYSEGWKIDPDGKQAVQTQKLNYGFAPLIGVNITFNELWGGNLSGSVKFSTKTAYDLGLSTRNITETFSRDINLSASYSKTGFSLPLFGISLQNDLEISVSYTNTRNSVVIFEMDNFIEDGKPQDGTIRTSLEPRIKYVMSSRVTLSLFYKSTTVEPEGAARIPPTSTSEAGLDVHISIQ